MSVLVLILGRVLILMFFKLFNLRIFSNIYLSYYNCKSMHPVQVPRLSSNFVPGVKTKFKLENVKTLNSLGSVVFPPGS